MNPARREQIREILQDTIRWGGNWTDGALNATELLDLLADHERLQSILCAQAFDYGVAHANAERFGPYEPVAFELEQL